MLNERISAFRAPGVKVKPDCVTPAHCDRIIGHAERFAPSSPGVEGQPAIWRLPADECPRVVREALEEYAARWGIAHRGVELPVRILRYDGESQTRWHADYKSESPRKVACVVQLSSPHDFDGGVIFAQGDGVSAETKIGRGYAFLFPGYIPHTVRVRSGKRWALAAWLGGEWQ